MTTVVHLVRHGSHDRLNRVLCGRMEGVSLGPAGRQEALALAERFSSEPVGALFCSPLQRALETAAPIGRALGLEPVTTDALNEIDLGDWTGASFEALAPRDDWRAWNRARSQAHAPNGESMLEVQVRVARWLNGIKAAFPDATVVGVCHADVIKAAVCHVMGLTLDHHARLEIAPASISTLLIDADGLRLQRLNTPP